MKRFILTTLCVLSVVAFSATTKAQTVTQDEAPTAFFGGLKVNEDGRRSVTVGVATEFAPRLVSISRSDVGGFANLTEEVGYQFPLTKWLSVMPFAGAGLESQGVNPVTFLTQSTGLAASITADSYVGWGVWGAAKYVGGPDSYTDKWQFGGGVWLGL